MNSKVYALLTQGELPNSISPTETLDLLGQFVDAAHDLCDQQALGQSRQHLVSLLATSHLPPNEQAIVHYFLGNAWGSSRTLHAAEEKQKWAWEDPCFDGEILSLRRALVVPGANLGKIRRCQTLTNLGNVFSNIGRFVEAIEYYDRALEELPGFHMASGNKGFCLFHYAGVLYNRGQATCMLRLAHPLLSDAARAKDVHSEAREGFFKKAKSIERLLGTGNSIPPLDKRNVNLGESSTEVAYRTWCLNNRLFLNPLNDILIAPPMAHDCLVCPSVVVRADEGPTCHAFYNQLKQEYVSARFLFYQGCTSSTSHFSDSKVRLLNTLDYPAYGLGVEQMKVAYRMAYSLFDKIAYFLNYYLSLEIPETKVYFRRLWYDQGKKGPKAQKILRSEFLSKPNWPLRGLFWLSKDLYEDEKGWSEVLEPAAQNLDSMRNHLEHKYLKLHLGLWETSEGNVRQQETGQCDGLAYSVSRSEFMNKSLNLLKLARAALIYLALAMHQEERGKQRQRNPSDPLIDMKLDLWKDEWKM